MEDLLPTALAAGFFVALVAWLIWRDKSPVRSTGASTDSAKAMDKRTRIILWIVWCIVLGLTAIILASLVVPAIGAVVWPSFGLLMIVAGVLDALRWSKREVSQALYDPRLAAQTWLGRGRRFWSICLVVSVWVTSALAGWQLDRMFGLPPSGDAMVSWTFFVFWVGVLLLLRSVGAKLLI